MSRLFHVENIDWWGLNWPLGTKMCFFDPEIWIFGANSQFLVLESDFWQQGILPVCPGLQLSHSDQPKKITFLSYGLSFFIFYRRQRNLVGLSGRSKKWTKMTRSKQELERNSRFNVRPKGVFLAKNAFYPKKTTTFLKRLISILEKGTFFFAELLPVAARTWCPERSICFFGPEILIFAIQPQFWSTARL